jgi:polar amino acid transport system substrate-binding protein
MRIATTVLAAALVVGVLSGGAASELAPMGTLRAVFIDGNPVQARVDAASGEVRGPAADLTRELARQVGVPFTIKPAPGVAAVIEAVKNARADIGFVAFDATRAEQVDFSPPYLLAHNTCVVRADSAYVSVKDLDRPGVRIGVGERDAGDLFLSRTLKSAALKRRPSSEILVGIRTLAAGELDAYAANRTRLLDIAASEPGLRVLPDNFYSVEQAIAVRKGNPERLAIVERFVAVARTQGLVQTAIDRAGLMGVDVAPAR